MIKIGRIRSRTFAYEQLAFALIHERRGSEAVKVCQHISRATFEEHCQRYVRELFFFPSDLSPADDEVTAAGGTTGKVTNDTYETDHVYDAHTISLTYFIDFLEQYPAHSRNLSVDTLFYSLFKAYEKADRLNDFTKLLRDRASKYDRHFSSRTKDALSQVGITVPVKSLSSPKPTPKRDRKNDRFLYDHEYEDEQQQHHHT